MSNDTQNGSDSSPEVLDPSSEAVVEREGLISVRETLRGRRILLTGSTGFLGKVYASMLLTRHPDIEQLYLIIRPRRGETAFDRFRRELIDCGAFDPLRDIYGPGLDDFLAEKVTVLAGDLTHDYFGLDAQEAKAISAAVDVVVNSAGLTNFNPNLENALEVNTLSARRIMEFIRLGGGRAKLLHVSTAFVAGATTEPTPEELPTPTRYPRVDELEVELDPVREVDDCLRLVKHVEELAEDQERQTHFTAEARRSLRDANRNPEDPELLEQARDDVRWNWIKRRLSNDGRERAAHWGWVNIYTYTKSLGERLIVTEGDDLEYALFRPAVIESAVAFPQVGWNEGINTTAPITYLSYKGHRFIPTHERAALDIIPVDMTVGSMLAITAALIRKCAHDVYHVGSSDRNKLFMPRIVELTTLGTRNLIDRDTSRSVVGKTVMKSLDSVPVSQKTFERQSLPGFARAARGLQKLIDRTPTDTMGGLGKALLGVKKSANRIERMASTGAKIFEIFKPFIYDNEYTFRARNIEDLATRLVPEEREVYGCPIADLDWREYWLDIHIPGLHRNAYPALEAKLSEATGDSWTYESLVDLFQSSTTNYSERVAMQHYDGGIVERYTYEELQQYARRGSEALAARGIGDGHTVMLVSENRPQWGMAYFAILDSGATAVPVDPESSVEQIVNLARSSKTAAIVVSDEVLADHADRLSEELEPLETDPYIVTFDSLFALQLTSDESDAPAARSNGALPTLFDPTSADDVASLIFTSGTTGDPKGVMLSHQNFTSLLRSLDGTFDIDESDGFLSVLPLHHTFEFTCGFLLPISRGSTITYLGELSGDELRAAMKSSRTTAVIGVPALWQLLHRRIEQNVSSGPAWRKWLFNRMVEVNSFLRQRFDINLGPMLFGPVHKAFGGKIRYLVSGGSALPGEILESFYGLGFDLYEGYGLTEAAPVLTVNRPKDGLAAGSVGRPLRGIDVEIDNPDDDGVGEVVARGDNVMLGYLNRPEETDRALEDGWLRTGDLGKFDRKGRLTIVGRSKETIVTAAGKNVYPDELEEIYGKCPHVLELSVVGLPDGQGNERVACLVRVDLPEDASGEEVAEKRQAVREWVRIEGTRVAPHNRIQVLKFWDQELPRTATRKVKRTEVIEIMQRLMQTDAGEESAVDDSWLARTVAQLAGVDPSELTPHSHFADDLAFDSLMTVELASILAERDVHLTPEQLATIDTFEQLEHAVEHGIALGAMVRTNGSAADRVDEIPVPSSVARLGKQWLHRAQMKAYEDLFDVDVFGHANIPYHNPNVIVVANHASHLDMGLAKYALGDFGTEIRALAAADYFFSNTARKTYFKNFTNLIPVERSGSPEVALRGAVQALQQGDTLLMFPEGTRATGGKLREFKRGLGYLVDRQRVDILPLHIQGTYEALPKGQPLPHPGRRNLRVRIGKVLSARNLLAQAREQDLSDGEVWDFVSRRAYEAVAELAAIGEPLSDEPLEPLFEELSGKFERDQVDETVSYYFSLGNVDDQKWTVIVEAESCVIKRGKPDGGRADCVVKTSPELFRRIVQESYIPSFDEFMNGTIKTNSPDLLMRFQSVFGLQR
jgi:long-chain acyl-CoA synthetase